MENERIAEKLRDPEGYAKERGKKSTPSVRRHQEETAPRQNYSEKENKQMASRISPFSFWLIPTVLVTMVVTVLMIQCGKPKERQNENRFFSKSNQLTISKNDTLGHP